MKKQKHHSEDFFLEEAVFDSWSSDSRLGSRELPLSRQTFILMLFLILFSGAAVILRTAFLNVLRSDFYQARSSLNVGKEVYEPAPRGLIYDRFGEVLAENIPAFSVAVKPSDLFKKSNANNLNILSGVLEVDKKEIENHLKDFNFENNSLIMIARNVDPQKIIQLKALNLNGVEVVSDFKRFYINGEIFSQIIGYTGAGKINEVVGKIGLEAFYDKSLKGRDGEMVFYRDAKGNVIGEKILEAAENGQNLYITIDGGLQKYFYKRLSTALKELNRKVGVGIAVNPKNGEILSLVVLPSFDNNVFSESGNSEARINLLNSSDGRLFNRAISGLYTPGSTVKPMEALAALKEGLITPQTQVFSAGFIEIPNPYNPSSPSRFLDWKPHGWVDLYSALARSSNIYFYAVGGGLGDIKGLGIEKLKKYWEYFGFGKKTGIDLIGESDGFLPDANEKEKRKNDIWRIGDTYNVSIGQGDLLVTPIQLVSQIASFANGGKFYKPHLLKDTSSEILIDYSDLKDYLEEIKIGMEDVVQKSYGTANMLSTLPIKTAGKTGSSQISNNTATNAFFVGYMPADDPEIAILVLIENAREGSLNAVPVAKDVLGWYYYNRLISKTN